MEEVHTSLDVINESIRSVCAPGVWVQIAIPKAAIPKAITATTNPNPNPR